MARPVILDCTGTAMTSDEAAVFRDLDPFGFILFARNCENPDQLRKLTDAMKNAVGREDVPILIDQEGGRVCRLPDSHWRRPPSAGTLRALYDLDAETGLEAIKVNARLMAEDLREMGITVDCYPPLDLRLPGADAIIGDRSFGAEPDIVSLLAAAACEGLMAGGVIPVIKHIPGHGRATVDSHLDLPTVDTSLEVMRATDFAPFKALKDMPLAMTAHITYDAIDAQLPATLSEQVIRRVIREEIGFTGVLISDDITMKALKGDPGDLAKQALRAGCDVVLHCNAPLQERRDVLESLYDFNVVNKSWIDQLFQHRSEVLPIDRKEITRWLNDKLAPVL
ncbi:beta-N-acetylhexosaminidase [Paremcibacter congregatus]|uniref:beta-N-acetylhexosaminidase n=1 Tax=Paremcibacter congregatus TaxID=2043170 RepID=A0A2G4YN27_9PROT|nr:beta-N-acetylhexosaminidase [Paremcibacter congregatus]PHZ83693.1 beta-N-acetylhexosaminidase [Paremcibacter congregatus]QDE27396.1 beta-N-acetylhexosaminidase [Paremcibacter congregatus]